MQESKTTILKVLTGSRAHGLHTETSDYDWRGVFVLNTAELLKLGNKPDQTSWIQGIEDDTSWEIGKFLLLATKCNPTILEAFKASPVTHETNKYGVELQSLFRCVWQPKLVMDAFVGYGLNQRKKFLDEKDKRPFKYAVAYLRTLYQAQDLLNTGTFSVSMKDTEVFDTLYRWKHDGCEYGEVIDVCKKWENLVQVAYDQNPVNPEYDLEKVNKFLLKVRKDYWNER